MIDLANRGFERSRVSRGARLTANLLVLLLLGMLPFGAVGVRPAVGQSAPAAADAPVPAAGGEAAGTAPAGPSAETPTHKDTGYVGPVIPPGQEDLLAQMLGRGAALAGQCEFTAGQVDGPILRATYKCSNGEVVFELCHPSKAPAGAVHTEQFAIVTKSGSPPDGLRDALVALIRSREAAFKWTWVAPPTPTGSFAAQPSSVRILLAIAGLLGCAVLAWVLYRRAPAAKP